MSDSLITLDEVKLYADIKSTNSDSEIIRLLPSVSQLIRTFCKRTFTDYATVAKVEIVNGGNSPYIYTQEPHILEITSLEVSDDYGVTYSALVQNTDYVLDKENDRIQSISSAEFTNKINGYKITYTAGYALADLPADLKQAALDLVIYYMRNDMSVKSNKAPGTNSVQIEYVTTSNMPAHIARILNQYRTDWI